MIKIIITSKEDVITNIVVSSELVVNGLLVTDENGDNYVIGRIEEDYNVYKDIDVPENIVIQKYKYTEAGGFVLNPDYKPYISVEQQISNLQFSTLNVQNIINSLVLQI